MGKNCKCIETYFARQRADLKNIGFVAAAPGYVAVFDEYENERDGVELPVIGWGSEVDAYPGDQILVLDAIDWEDDTGPVYLASQVPGLLVEVRNQAHDNEEKARLVGAVLRARAAREAGDDEHE